MSRRSYRRQRSDSLADVVFDCAYIAARLGPVGAFTTGAVGFTVFYAVLPFALLAWSDTNKAKLSGPLAAAFANLLDQVTWYRFIEPCQWCGVGILVVCWAIALRKFYEQRY